METLNLVSFDKENVEHIIFLRKLLRDKTISERFNGLLPQLNAKHNDGVIGKGFFLADGDELVGYVDIGQYNVEEEAVYIRGAVDKDKRGNHYGYRLLSETTDYIFANYPKVRNVKVKIAEDNTASLKTAGACGFIWLGSDYYGKSNPYEKEVKVRK